MKFESTDFKVGAVVLAAFAILVAAFLWLSPVAQDTTAPLFAEFPRLEGIAESAPVTLHGYTVGRVDQIRPTLRKDGTVAFRMRMSINWKFPDGSTLPLPIGTIARLSPPPVQGSGFLVGTVVLDPPARGTAGLLQPGDTVPGAMMSGVMDQAQGVMDNANKLLVALTADVGRTLASTRVLMDSLRTSSGTMNATAQVALRELPLVMRSVQMNLATADSLLHDLRTLRPATLASMDTATRLLADSRKLVGDVNKMLATREPQVDRMMANLEETTILLNHFMAQVSRRPFKVLTGVSIPDTIAAIRARAATCGAGTQCAASRDSAARDSAARRIPTPKDSTAKQDSSAARDSTG